MKHHLQIIRKGRFSIYFSICGTNRMMCFFHLPYLCRADSGIRITCRLNHLFRQKRNQQVMLQGVW